jgi:hypothetical protein
MITVRQIAAKERLTFTGCPTQTREGTSHTDCR